MKTITITKTSFSGNETSKEYTQEEYVKQWTESIGVGSLWYLERSDHYKADRAKVKLIRKLIEEMAIANFEDLLTEKKI